VILVIVVACRLNYAVVLRPYTDDAEHQHKHGHLPEFWKIGARPLLSKFDNTLGGICIPIVNYAYMNDVSVL